MENQSSDQLAATLVNRFENGADVVQIADVIISTWQEISAALCPIIGQRGVVALYNRSLHLTSRTHLWLRSMPECTPTAIDFAALKSILTQQSSADAAAGGDSLLQTFQELLSVLIGHSLTARLLDSARANSSDSSTLKQDPTS